MEQRGDGSAVDWARGGRPSAFTGLGTDMPIEDLAALLGMGGFHSLRRGAASQAAAVVVVVHPQHLPTSPPTRRYLVPFDTPPAPPAPGPCVSQRWTEGGGVECGYAELYGTGCSTESLQEGSCPDC